MRTLLLDGNWTLSGSGATPVAEIPAQVPGNIELDLERAGLIPDPFFGCNEKLLRPYEFTNWCYRREFDLPADFPDSIDLVFDGIDCVATILVNGVEAGHAENAFLRHRFVVDTLLERGGRNTLEVKITSPILAARDLPLEHHDFALWRNFEALQLRKPAHSYGWDIAPRLILGGLWRSVRLEERKANRMLSCYFDTIRADRKQAEVAFSFSFATDLESWNEFEIELHGKSGQSEFRHRHHATFNSGRFSFNVDRPNLWYPAGYGNPDLYSVEIIVRADGRELFRTGRTIGIRMVKLIQNDTPGDFVFRFEVNEIPIMVKGSNWVPADALHSRDRFRTKAILELFTECGCNMVRVWGGGVYESPEFYDYCDRHGIMIWQDFMIACATAPLTERFLDLMRRECEAIVPELRQHPALVLWAGDNEVDQFAHSLHDGLRPSGNRLTREVIPQVLYRLDPNRIYLPSSPYIPPATEALGLGDDRSPEQHVWGPRDYFKSPFYRNNPAAFISEAGYHGAPAVSSIKRFLSPDKLWPAFDNPEWITHATEGYSYRVKLMFDQIREYFGITPNSLEEFVEASQIVQAEAKKFMIENVRFHKWKKSGIIWWNMMDCWPQFSDAVVDYYFEKKLAFEYIKNAQQPLLAIVGEWNNWGHEVVMTNDLLTPEHGTLKVYDADSNDIYLETEFDVPANANVSAGFFRLPNSEHHCLLLEWHTDSGLSGTNHYHTGTPYFLFPVKRK